MPKSWRSASVRSWTEPRPAWEGALHALRQGVRDVFAFLVGPRWAVFITAVMALLALVGVVLPQLPAWAVDDPASREAWVSAQEGKLGPAAHWLWRVGLLNVFRAPWFAAGLGLLVFSLVAYSLSRLPGLYAAVLRPRKWPPDTYFQVAPLRLEAAGRPDLRRLVGGLRRRLYRVEVRQEGETTYLFADRFPWAQVGTVLAHAAVVVLVVAAAVGKAEAFSIPILLAEGQVRPVFPSPTHPRQMQVEVVEAQARFDRQGLPLEYGAQVVVYRQGEAVARCRITVNAPCQYQGYRFHLAAYFGFGAEVVVREAASGRALYHETLALQFPRPTPHLVVREEGSGRLVYEGAPALGGPIPTDEGATSSLALLSLHGRDWVVALQERGEKRTLLIADAQDLSRALTLAPGEAASLEGLRWELMAIEMAPAARVTDLPSPEGGDVLLQMVHVAYGTGTASEGGRVPVVGGEGPPLLYVLGVGERPLALRPGEAAQVGPYQYQFLGQRGFVGIEVRRDPSTNLVWAGAALLILGLVLAFWLPRRRLWARVRADEVCIVGQGGEREDMAKELAPLLRKAGASPRWEVGDDG